MGTRIVSILTVSLAILMAVPLLGTGLAGTQNIDSRLRPRGDAASLTRSSEATTAGAPSGSATLQHDDGTYEGAFGVVDSSGETGNQAVYMNRFSPSEDELPLSIDTVSILFPVSDPNGSTGLRPRMTFRVLVYVDEAATGDPLNATLVARKTFDLEPSNTVFQNITLDEVVEIAKGDVYIGFTDVVTGVTNQPIFPAAFDANGGIHSAFAFHNFARGSHFDGEDLRASDSGAIFLSGSWLIRAFYTTGGSVRLCWAPGSGSGENPAPENARLCGQGGGKDDANGTAARGTLLGFNVYRSTTSPVQTTPANLFTTTGPNQTSASSGVSQGGSFFVITGTYDTGESGPSNEVAAKPPSITTIKVKSTKITAKGGDFSPGLRVFVDGIPFAAPPTVKGGKKVIQKGTLLTGQTIGAYLAANGNTARITFRNDTGAATTLDHPR